MSRLEKDEYYICKCGADGEVWDDPQHKIENYCSRQYEKDPRWIWTDNDRIARYKRMQRYSFPKLREVRPKKLTPDKIRSTWLDTIQNDERYVGKGIGGGFAVRATDGHVLLADPSAAAAEFDWFSQNLPQAEFPDPHTELALRRLLILDSLAITVLISSGFYELYAQNENGETGWERGFAYGELNACVNGNFLLKCMGSWPLRLWAKQTDPKILFVQPNGAGWVVGTAMETS